MRNTVHQVLQNCAMCIQAKDPFRKLPGLLQPIQVIQPFELVSWDIMGPLPQSTLGNKYIIVFYGVSYQMV